MGQVLHAFFLPTFFGNVIGGISLLALLGHAQVVPGKES
jgi:formate/nitrite transporter FocA (FNT family)